MNNLNVLILGMTGSGKTSLAKRLLNLTPRAFVFDPMDDYEDGALFFDFDSAFAFYEENIKRDFHLIYRGPRSDYLAWLDILWESQGALDLPPLGIFLEESSWYSTSHTIEEALDTVYTKGRRHKISIVTVTQRDTQINPIIRANSRIWVSMRQRKFSTDVKEIFTNEELERIKVLETFTPVTDKAISGKHYIQDTPDFDLFRAWVDVVA